MARILSLSIPLAHGLDQYRFYIHLNIILYPVSKTNRIGTATTTDRGKPTRHANWGQQKRLEFIDFRLCWDGRLNRSDLIDFFGISLPQASLDLARYMEIAPENINYDKTGKAYLPSACFKPAVASVESTAYLELLTLPRSPQANFIGWKPDISLVPHPNRRVETSVLRQVLFAIRNRQMVHVEYQSMNRPSSTVRAISPHAIGYDGFRWHTRAYCHEHKSFRDFVFARILKVNRVEESSIDPKKDEAWERALNLVLAPHPDLSAGQRRAVELDYGMKRGRIVLRTRRALAFYVLRQLGLDQTTNAPRAQHIVLLNRDKIEPFLNSHE